MKQSGRATFLKSKSSHLAVLLFVVWIFPYLFGFLFLQIEKQSVKREVSRMFQRSYPEDELVWLKFSKQDAKRYLHWEHESEFSYQQKMYDVLRKQETADSLFLLCYFDKKETRINTLLSDIGFNQPLNQQEKNTFRMGLLHLFNAPPACLSGNMSIFRLQEGLMMSAYLFVSIVQCTQPESPPPRYLFAFCC